MRIASYNRTAHGGASGSAEVAVSSQAFHRADRAGAGSAGGRRRARSSPPRAEQGVQAWTAGSRLRLPPAARRISPRLRTPRRRQRPSPRGRDVQLALRQAAPLAGRQRLQDDLPRQDSRSGGRRSTRAGRSSAERPPQAPFLAASVTIDGVPRMPGRLVVASVRPGSDHGSPEERRGERHPAARARIRRAARLVREPGRAGARAAGRRGTDHPGQRGLGSSAGDGRPVRRPAREQLPGRRDVSELGAQRCDRLAAPADHRPADPAGAHHRRPGLRRRRLDVPRPERPGRARDGARPRRRPRRRARPARSRHRPDLERALVAGRRARGGARPVQGDAATLRRDAGGDARPERARRRRPRHGRPGHAGPRRPAAAL